MKRSELVDISHKTEARSANFDIGAINNEGITNWFSL